MSWLLLRLHSMVFAQRRNRLTTYFSERIPVVKRRMTVLKQDCVWHFHSSVSSTELAGGSEDTQLVEGKYRSGFFGVSFAVLTRFCVGNHPMWWFETEQRASVHSGKKQLSLGPRTWLQFLLPEDKLLRSKNRFWKIIFFKVTVLKMESWQATYQPKT